MATNLKALLVILSLALLVFHIAKPICLKFVSKEDYFRRRNIWIALTVVAFVSPSFWIYACVAFVTAYFAARKDSTPIALFVMLLHVIPPFSVKLPSIVVNQLFDVNNFRILELAILLPVAWGLWTTKNKNDRGNYKAIDRLLWLYFALQIVLLFPYEDITNTIRRGFLILIDSIILVYVVTRTCSDAKRLNDVMATFCLVCAIFVSVAIFEYVKVWLVYTGFAAVWEIPSQGLYLFRDGALRAQASTGHSLVLGYLLAVAVGFWLHLESRLPTRTYRILGIAGLGIGLIATMSRGPWLTAVLIYALYLLVNKGGVLALFKQIAIATPFVIVLLLTPLGPKVIDKLPFVGKVDAANIEYRQRLAESSWELIKENPFFGDPFYKTHLEHMRQGEGIIDMVNVYASISLLFGLVGLTLFFGPFAVGVHQVWGKLKQQTKLDPDITSLGRGLFASMLGTAFFIATASFYLGIPVMYYLLIGLAAAYGQLKNAPSDKTSSSNEDQRKSFARN